MARVLIIEDESPMRSLIRIILEKEGYDVADTLDGEEGIKLLKDQPADLVIADILMPVKDGIETIMELKADFPDTKIIAISGGGPFKDKDNLLVIAKKLGADYALTKPFKIEDLLKATGELLG